MTRRTAFFATFAWMVQQMNTGGQTRSPFAFRTCKSEFEPTHLAVFFGDGCTEFQTIDFYFKGERVSYTTAEIFAALKEGR